MEPRPPALQAGSLPAAPPRKPNDTGVGSLSLLQQIFLTQGSNWGLLHGRQILDQLSYQGSPCDSAYLSGEDRCTALSSQTPLPFISLLYAFHCQDFHLAFALDYKMLSILKSYVSLAPRLATEKSICYKMKHVIQKELGEGRDKLGIWY